MDFLQTENGDLDLSRGLRQTDSMATFALQKVSETIAFVQGEERLDMRLGVPWPRYKWGRRYDAPLIDLLYRRTLRKTPGVAAVERLVLEFDSASRQLFVSGVVRPLGDDDPVSFERLIVGVQ